MRTAQTPHSRLAACPGGCSVYLPDIGSRGILERRRLPSGPGTRNAGRDRATPRHNIAKGHLKRFTDFAPKCFATGRPISPKISKNRSGAVYILDRSPPLFLAHRRRPL